MRKILFTNKDSLKQQVDLIRYFKYKNDYYLIYTLNERDEKNFLKLYLVKVLKELDEYIGYNISENDEWKKMQGIIKKVIKDIKSGKQNSFEDVDCDEIMGISIADPRSFKLDQELVDILMSDYKFDNNDNNVNNYTIFSDNETSIKMTESNGNDESYKQLYIALKNEKTASDKLMDDLLNKVLEYKTKYGDIEGE